MAAKKKRKKERSLTVLQYRFAHEYVRGGCKSTEQAALRAGYSKTYAQKLSHKLIGIYRVKKLIARLRKTEDKKTIAAVAERKEILTEIARGRLTDFVETVKGAVVIKVNPDCLNTSAVKKLKTSTIGSGDFPTEITEIQLADPVRAINELNKMEGEHAPEKREISGTLGIVNIEEMDDEHLIEFAKARGINLSDIKTGSKGSRGT